MELGKSHLARSPRIIGTFDDFCRQRPPQHPFGEALDVFELESEQGHVFESSSPQPGGIQSPCRRAPAHSQRPPSHQQYRCPPSKEARRPGQSKPPRLAPPIACSTDYYQLRIVTAVTIRSAGVDARYLMAETRAPEESLDGSRLRDYGLA